MNGISILSDTNPLIYLLLDNCFIAELTPQIKGLVKDLMQGFRVKLPDAIIAATALYLDLPLLTADAGFKKIPDIKLILLDI